MFRKALAALALGTFLTFMPGLLESNTSISGVMLLISVPICFGMKVLSGLA